jgi:hypothetical protein
MSYQDEVDTGPLDRRNPNDVGLMIILAARELGKSLDEVAAMLRGAGFPRPLVKRSLAFAKKYQAHVPADMRLFVRARSPPVGA